MHHPLFYISSTALISCCLFCSILLWTLSKESKPKKILAISFSVSTLFNTYYVLKTLYLHHFETEILDFSYGLFCLFLAYIAFLYFRTLMQPERNNKPIVFQLIGSVLFYSVLYWILQLTGQQVWLSSFDSVKENIDVPIVWLRLWVFIHFVVTVLVLCILTLKMYKKHTEDIRNRFSYSENITLSWLPYMLTLFIFVGIGTSFDIFLPVNGMELSISNFSYAAFNLVIGIMATLQKDIYPAKEKMIETENQMSDVLKNHSISPSTYLLLKEDLNRMMENEKLYRNPELRIDSIAKLLGTNRTYLSLIIKEDFNKNFIEFVNYYRIEEAKILIAQVDNRSSFVDIAEQVGFKSISSFNTFFKRFTGKTPTEYRKANL